MNWLTPHRIVDTWRDVVVVCSCGWRAAAKTKKRAEYEWREHVIDHDLNYAMLDRVALLQKDKEQTQGDTDV